MDLPWEILPLVDSLWCSLQVAAWGPETSSKMVAIMAAILDFNSKNSKNWNLFDAGHLEHDRVKHSAAFCRQFVLLFTEKKWKNAFSSKMGWPPTAYDNISRNRSYRFSLVKPYFKMYVRKMRSATENGRCWWKIVLKNSRETLQGGGGIHPSPIPNERARVKILFSFQLIRKKLQKCLSQI